MASIFTKIIQGEIPAFKIAETDHALAFLDIRPLVPGHTLVVPKTEVDQLFDLPEIDYLHCWTFAQQIGHAIKSVVSCQRVGISVIGLEVPHAHIHLIPLNEMQDMNFLKPKLSLHPNEMETIAEQIRSAYLKLGAF